jgi:hypothetical protein
MSSQTLTRGRRIAQAVFGVAFVAGMLLVNNPGYARVDADPNADYSVTRESGEWMIIVQSYGGELAGEQARKLALELRSKYDLPAYIFNRGKEERAKQDDEIQKRRKQQEDWLRERGLTTDMPFRMPHVRIEEQFAVMIGGYRDLNEASRALEKIKKLPPPSKELMDYIPVALPSADKKSQGRLEGAYLNPFLRAFCVPNPTIPKEKPKEQAFDPLIKEMNADETYSVFKCPKPWTLKVKEFTGGTVVVQKSAPTKFIESLFGKHQDTLGASAMQAHEIARVLRDHMKLEAYVMHTRYGSVVTVGGYDSKDDPRLLQSARTLANLQMGPVIKFDPVPLPMAVPKVN